MIALFLGGPWDTEEREIQGEPPFINVVLSAELRFDRLENWGSNIPTSTSVQIGRYGLIGEHVTGRLVYSYIGQESTR